MLSILDQISKLDKVLILGFAREGQSTYKFLRSKFPNLTIVLADQDPAATKPNDLKVITHFGPNYLTQLSTVNCQLIIKSPGISPHKPEIEAAKKAGVVFTSHMQIFFEVCPSKNTIGITGTKGKSTTTSLIHEVLKANGLPTVLVGNIGKPALDYLLEITPETWVVMELSSYQLMDLTVSPHIAVLQAIYPDHLDYHSDFDEYKNAKLNITKFQSPTDYLITQLDIPTKAQKIIFSISDYNSQIPTKLLGEHNKLNIIPALKIVSILGLPKLPSIKAIENFQPLDTRLEMVATKNGILFFADTLATIPEATIAAISALHSDLETLIAGGHDRKQNYSELAKSILNSNIKTLILFPATGSRIAQEIESLVRHEQIEASQTSRAALPAGRQADRRQSPGVEHVADEMPNPRSVGSINIFHASSMPEAVQLALDHTASGKICLLSPAAPSFTLFKDYKDEYDQYKRAIIAS